MRRSGRTTRLIDEAIQELLTYYKVSIVDHHETRNSSFELLKRFKSRLEFEHNLFEKKNYNVMGNKCGFEVELED